MKTPADIIPRLQMMAQDGTRANRRLAAMVLSDPDFISRAAISEIAARAAISEPTVTRFCRYLGCEGLRDFKLHLAQAIAIGGLYLSADPPGSDVREQRIASAITESAVAAIQRTAASLSMAKLLAVAERIAVSGNVLCIGSGGIASMMATEMQNRLFRLGLPVLAQVDGQLQHMYASVATAQTTVVAFSVSGYARSTIEAVQVARQYGAATVAVTPQESALAREVETLIPFQPLEDGNIYKPTSARYALLVILDIIATATAEARGAKALENLRRIKQSINTLKVSDPCLPIGD